VDVFWLDAAQASALELLTGRREEAAREYLRGELAFVKSRFRELSEARPWGEHQEPEKEMPEFSRAARDLFVPLVQLWNPKYHERMMEAARTVATELTTRDSGGRLRFRSSWFGAEGVQDKVKYGIDRPGNALFCHPVLFLAFYGRHPASVKFLEDWIDGWLEIFAKNVKKDSLARFPSATLMDGSVLNWDTKIRGTGYIDCYAALHAITGDSKYASLTPYWTGPRGRSGSYMRGGNYLAALEMIDWRQWRNEISDWADRMTVGRWLASARNAGRPAGSTPPQELKVPAARRSFGPPRCSEATVVAATSCSTGCCCQSIRPVPS
jgi:hypothetical protein